MAVGEKFTGHGFARMNTELSDEREEEQIPRTPSPRKRGCGRLGMTRVRLTAEKKMHRVLRGLKATQDDKGFGSVANAEC